MDDFFVTVFYDVGKRSSTMVFIVDCVRSFSFAIVLFWYRTLESKSLFRGSTKDSTLSPFRSFSLSRFRLRLRDDQLLLCAVKSQKEAQ